jgi:hypothetical protein
MINAYIRVSTDRQSTENRRFEILKFATNPAQTLRSSALAGHFATADPDRCG